MNGKRARDAYGSAEPEIETPTWRPSGVRRAVGCASELLHKLAADDCKGGAGSIYEVLDRVACLVGAPVRSELGVLDARARWLLPFVDGESSVEDAMQASGMPPVDALLGMCELVARGIVRLAPSSPPDQLARS